MNSPETSPKGEGPGSASTLHHRIQALERGIRVWRCLTAVGFLTALGAFALAVFGLGQLENTYFIGEVAVSSTPPHPLEGVRMEAGEEMAGALEIMAPETKEPLEETLQSPGDPAWSGALGPPAQKGAR
jgi:hypothetical protein